MQRHPTLSSEKIRKIKSQKKTEIEEKNKKYTADKTRNEKIARETPRNLPE